MLLCHGSWQTCYCMYNYIILADLITRPAHKDIILEDHPDAKVTVINSLLNSASFSLFIYQALQMRKAGYSYENNQSP
ncbi:MAG: hypothetical protein ACLT33_07990 [Lachnospira pectinoschiza]